MTSRNRLKLETLVRFANDLAKLSTCKRQKNAAIVFPADYTEVWAIGYNGPPVGKLNDACRGVGAVGSCGCVHAEANAVAKLGQRYGAILYCTTSPCETCAGLIANCRKIVRVVYGATYRDPTPGLEVLRAAGIPSYELSELLKTELNA